MKHVMVFGAQGCGKTLNKELLAKTFDCERIEDGVSRSDFKALAVNATVKTLFITCDDMSTDDYAASRRCDIIPFDVAMRAAGVPVLGTWQSAGSKPQTAEGTELAVRMRGVREGESAFVEVDGFYLNEYGLYYDDGCECFADGEHIDERERHDNHGCPHSGFYYVDLEDGEEGTYQPFRAVEWCKR